MSATKSRRSDLRRERRTNRHGCWDHLVVAPLWVAYKANLGTLLRTCDAVGACIAVPDTDHYRESLAVGDTLRFARRPCIHWVRRGRDRWIAEQRARQRRLVVVELAEDAIPLPRLEPAREATIVLLGLGEVGLNHRKPDLQLPGGRRGVPGSSARCVVPYPYSFLCLRRDDIADDNCDAESDDIQVNNLDRA